MRSGTGNESRDSQRIKVFKGGTIAYHDRQITWPCVVRNISQTGALIQSANASQIPDTFNLIVDLDGLDVECEVLWRSGTKVGVGFTGHPKFHAPARLQIIDPSAKNSVVSLRKQDSKGVEVPSQVGTEESIRKENLVRSTQRLLHVVIAEDDPDDRYFISEAFEECDVACTIQFAEDGEDVLKYLFGLDEYEGRPQPDLIILDLNMPKIEGRAALSEIKQHEETRAIPVVILTTSSFDDDIASTYDLGVSSYITKPPGLHEFKGIVQELLSYWSSSAVRRPLATMAG